jgi:RND family efflux transporter MFP subunit
MRKAVIGGLALGIAVLLATGYSMLRGGDAQHAGAAPASTSAGAASGAGGAPVAISSVRAQHRDVDVVLEATGTVTALNSVDIRPQISSVITQVHIREGQFVKKGQLLFTLDARNDEVNVTKARAQLAKDMAALADAQRQLARSRDLFAQNFISQGAVDTNQTLVESQQAVVAADRAAIEAAQVGLSYTRIVAPTAGRAGAINVFPGTLVQSTGPVLVTITQLDPIAVGFSLPQRNLGEALQTLRGGGGKVFAVLPEGRGTITGRLQFVDNAVDAGSGTVRAKAEFGNADEKLWPGAFVNVRFAVQTLKAAVVVPQAAIITGPGGRIVYVVDAGDKAQPRPVEITLPFGEEAVVTGLRAGERIVVEGRQNLRPGARVVERAPTDAGRPRHGPGGASAPAAAASGAMSRDAGPGSSAAATLAGPYAMASGATR